MNILVDGIFHEKRLTQNCGLASLAAYGKSRGHDLVLFAPNNRRLDEERAAAWILERAPAFVGVSLLSRFQYPSFGKLAGALRHSGWKGLLVAGGHWASLAHDRLLRETEELDLVVVGDGEETLADLLDRLRSGTDWRDLAGLARRDPSGLTRFNGPRSLGPLDSYPPMDTSLIRELVQAYGPTVRVGVIASRGCYGDCAYCSVKAYNRLQRAKPYRMRSLERVVDEIQMIHDEFGISDFSFEDDNFVLPGRAGVVRLEELGRLLEERGLRLDLWVQTRPECVSLEAMTLLKRAGVRTIFIGTESFDPATLALYNRGNTLEENLEALDVLESLGFSCDVNAENRIKFGAIIFHPYVTLDVLRAQAQHWRRYHIPAGKLLRRLRPGGEGRLCRRLEEEGLVGEDGEYLFARPEVDAVYWTLHRFFSEYHPLRDEIRSVEKINRKDGLTMDVGFLRRVREAIEEHLVSLFEELCLAGQEGNEAIERAYRRRCDLIEGEFDFGAVRARVKAALAETAGHAVSR